MLVKYIASALALANALLQDVTGANALISARAISFNQRTYTSNVLVKLVTRVHFH